MAGMFRALFLITVVTALYSLFLTFNSNSGIRWSKRKKFLRLNSHATVSKYINVSAERWIVVTTISYPTPDIKFLAKIPGWKLVVVGDTKTPKNWSLPNCIYLNLEDQYGLGLETVNHLPVRSYARKTVGYLFAIAHGARIIYETDDDNRPLDLLKNFILHETMWGLSYNGTGAFNPYRHFGQLTLWPRGYPLSFIGENFTTDYRLDHFKTPSIQQGVVNGDPDMDAIFRLTRKKTLSVLNVTFDSRTPPVIVPAGVFSPFNSQNTLFLYDALWALLIPTTTTFRVCDIWRGYWAQRLLWEMGGNLGFFPPNAFQKRNSHSYLLDAIDEKDLYFETERLLKFLKEWKCKPENAFFDCMIQLSTGMASNKFWDVGDQLLTLSWVHDLRAIGYREPARIPFGSVTQGIQIIKRKKLPKQSRLPRQMSVVNFWPVEQNPPLKYPIKKSHPLVSHLTRYSAFCNNMFGNISLLSANTSLKTFPNILLIIVFNFPHYDNIQFLEALYKLHFSHILYCGSGKKEFDKYVRNMKPVSFIEVNVFKGWFAHNCLTQAMRMNYNVDGYLYVGDDTLLNVWNLHKLPWDQLWLIDGTVLRQSGNTTWYWINRPDVGLKRYQAAVESFASLAKGKVKQFFALLARNTGYDDGFLKCPSDIAYIPRRYKDDVVYFLEHFSKFNLFVEIAIPTVLGGLELWEKVYKLPGTYLWYDGKRDHIENYFNRSNIFLHPVKISRELKETKGVKFFCETFIPLTLRDGRYIH